MECYRAEHEYAQTLTDQLHDAQSLWSSLLSKSALHFSVISVDQAAVELTSEIRQSRRHLGGYDNRRMWQIGGRGCFILTPTPRDPYAWVIKPIPDRLQI